MGESEENHLCSSDVNTNFESHCNASSGLNIDSIIQESHHCSFCVVGFSLERCGLVEVNKERERLKEKHSEFPLPLIMLVLCLSVPHSLCKKVSTCVMSKPRAVLKCFSCKMHGLTCVCVCVCVCVWF